MLLLSAFRNCCPREASANGFTLSGTWRQQFDWAVVEWNRDNVYEHPAIRYLPDPDLSGLELSYLEQRSAVCPAGIEYLSLGGVAVLKNLGFRSERRGCLFRKVDRSRGTGRPFVRQCHRNYDADRQRLGRTGGIGIHRHHSRRQTIPRTLV